MYLGHFQDREEDKHLNKSTQFGMQWLYEDAHGNAF